MPRRNNLSKAMVVGSGPIVVGRAAEFDYAGTQACKLPHNRRNAMNKIVVGALCLIVVVLAGITAAAATGEGATSHGNGTAGTAEPGTPSHVEKARALLRQTELQEAERARRALRGVRDVYVGWVMNDPNYSGLEDLGDEVLHRLRLGGITPLKQAQGSLPVFSVLVLVMDLDGLPPSTDYYKSGKPCVYSTTVNLLDEVCVPRRDPKAKFAADIWEETEVGVFTVQTAAVVREKAIGLVDKFVRDCLSANQGEAQGNPGSKKGDLHK